MQLISKTADLAIRILFDRQLGTRVHVLHGEDELVLCPTPLRVVQGTAPDDVRRAAFAWITSHQKELLIAWNRYLKRRTE